MLCSSTQTACRRSRVWSQVSKYKFELAKAAKEASKKQREARYAGPGQCCPVPTSVLELGVSCSLAAAAEARVASNL